MSDLVKWNVGCSDDHKPGYVNIDRVPPADIVNDLSGRWPGEDSSVDEVFAHDVAEHMPKIHFMNEAWRVLKPGGVLDFLVPCVYLSDGLINPGAFADPTHVAYWTMDDKYYYCTEWNNSGGERGRLSPGYGITALFDIKVTLTGTTRREHWEMLEYGRLHERRSKVKAMLIAVK